MTCAAPAFPSRAEAGFTLLEVLIATAIIGLAGAVVVLNLAPPLDRDLRMAERMAADLNGHRAEGALAGVPVRVGIAGTGLEAARWTRQGWVAIETSKLDQAEGLASLRLEGVDSLFLDPLWSRTEGALLVGREEALWRIQADASGRFIVSPVQPE